MTVARQAQPPGDMTRNFSRAEFACKCGCGFDSINPDLVAALQTLRDLAAEPITILCGCRCAKHNLAVGGVPESRHLTGDAADLRIEGMTAREMYRLANALSVLRGLGVDDQRNFLHADVRPVRARWCYLGGREAPWWEPVENLQKAA